MKVEEDSGGPADKKNPLNILPKMENQSSSQDSNIASMVTEATARGLWGL